MSHAEELYRAEVITFEMVNPFVGKKFRILNIQGDEYHLTLGAAEPIDLKQWPHQFRAPFTLMFYGAPELPPLPQGQFLVQAPKGPVWGIFITPVITLDRSKGQMYQAVFA